MAEGSSETRLARSLKGLVHGSSEIMHVAAVYLGIAVVVTIVLGITVPSLRQQLQQLHSAVVVSLRPLALDEVDLAHRSEDRAGRIWSRMSERSAQEGGPQGREAKGARETDANAPVETFADALQAVDSFTVPGVSRAQSQSLRSYIARKYRIAHSAAGILIRTAFEVAREHRLDPQLVLAVIAIESRYNPFAESHVGAQGLMQVMTKVHLDKFESLDAGPEAALEPITNIRVGAQILRDCIDRRGSVKAGLACYVGATGPGDGGYGAKVLAERRRIALASGIPLGR